MIIDEKNLKNTRYDQRRKARRAHDVSCASSALSRSKNRKIVRVQRQSVTGENTVSKIIKPASKIYRQMYEQEVRDTKRALNVLAKYANK